MRYSIYSHASLVLERLCISFCYSGVISNFAQHYPHVLTYWANVNIVEPVNIFVI